jgi:predicted AAA+ superfamily ATPase
VIERENYLLKINTLIKDNPVVALIGPRQVGKTTLARRIASEYSNATFFDLENPLSLSRLQDPLLALQSLEGLIVIDEIQHQPDLFKVLRVLVDEPRQKRKFLVLGSASPLLLKQTSESLAGRIAYLEISGFSLQEVGMPHLTTLWLRGTFPRAYLANSQKASVQWRQDFIRTFLERDLPQLGINIPAITMRRFWMMLAHYHGQNWNASEFSRAFGMSDKSVRHYLDILTSTFVIKQVAPWWENISKRQVKSPRIYLNDSGLLHTLLGLNNKEELESHPKVGASWEGFAMNAVIAQFNALPEEVFYWSTHSGAEIDLVIVQGNRRLGFEFKRTASPALTKSLITACTDLALTQAYVIYAGSDIFPLNKQITALGLSRITELGERPMLNQKPDISP